MAKSWDCLKILEHEPIGKVIADAERQGWRLYTYQAATTQTGLLNIVAHYLLFVKEE